MGGLHKADHDSGGCSDGSARRARDPPAVMQPRPQLSCYRLWGAPSVQRAQTSSVLHGQGNTSLFEPAARWVVGTRPTMTAEDAATAAFNIPTSAQQRRASRPRPIGSDLCNVVVALMPDIQRAASTNLTRSPTFFISKSSKESSSEMAISYRF
jgi:hypothetical protein